MGFYDPEVRVVVVNLGLSVGNLRHEMVHALVSDDDPEIPAWLNEGMGALYGNARQTADGFRFLVNYRLRHLRAARKAGTLPDLAALASSSPEDVYGARVLAFYAQARYLLLWLDQRGSLQTFLRELRAGPRDAARQRAILEKHVDYAAYLRWTDTLVIGTPAGK
jgi:hypothetical protein